MQFLIAGFKKWSDLSHFQTWKQYFHLLKLSEFCYLVSNASVWWSVSDRKSHLAELQTISSNFWNLHQLVFFPVASSTPAAPCETLNKQLNYFAKAFWPRPALQCNFFLQSCGNMPIKCWPNIFHWKAHQSSGSQSLKPFAKGLLAIFSCVIWK